MKTLDIFIEAFRITKEKKKYSDLDVNLNYYKVSRYYQD